MKSSFLPLAAAISALALHTSCKPKPTATATAPAPETAAVAPAAEAPAPLPPQGNAGGNRAGAGAGGQGNFQQRAEERMQRMKAAVGLTDDQTQKVSAIYERQFGTVREQGQSMSREDRRAAFDKARTAASGEIEQILTPEQKPKWEAFQKEEQERRAQRRQGGGGGN